jgi:hypothetical protein
LVSGFKKEEGKPRMYENRAMTAIFEPRMDERKLVRNAY